MEIALYIVMLAFALTHGLNTGASLLATSVNIRGLSRVAAFGILLLGVAVSPLLFGTAVANTIANELVPWSGETSRVGIIVAVSVTLAAIAVLTYLKIPTSLTLALIGAVAGFGFIAVGSVDSANIAKVLTLMFLAPLLSGVFAWLITTFLLPILPRISYRKYIESGHRIGFTLMSFAYGANDAQKMLAVGFLATGISGELSLNLLWIILGCTALFGLGSLFGLRKMAQTIATGVLPARPLDMVITETATSATMILSTAAGSPVGLAQTMSGALIGTGISYGYSKVRWQLVGKILLAWVTTLPVTFGIAALIALVVVQ